MGQKLSKKLMNNTLCCTNVFERTFYKHMGAQKGFGVTIRVIFNKESRESIQHNYKDLTFLIRKNLTTPLEIGSESHWSRCHKTLSNDE